MKKRLNIYFFGQIGIYNEESPEYILEKAFVPEILYIIAKHDPFTINGELIANDLKMDKKIFSKVISQLKHIGLIDVKKDTYRINFPVFLEEDLETMDKALMEIGKVLGDVVVGKKEIIYDKIKGVYSYNTFSKERLLYHIICDKVFDGTALEYFGEKGVFCVSKKRPGNRDYIVIGYEDSEKVELHSSKLLCSSNNYRSNGFTFNSFGDGNGERKDMYRFFRKTQVALEEASGFNDTNLAYIQIIENKNREIAGQCGKLILNILENKIQYSTLSSEEKSLFVFLRQLGYVDFSENTDKVTCKVPIFCEEDEGIINEISFTILSSIHDMIMKFFQKFEHEKIDITAIKHNVDIKEIANELWHQVFGNINEYLINIGFVETPDDIEGEGRYLRSMSIEK